MSEPLFVDLWLGGETADRLRAFAKASHKEPAEVLSEMASHLDPALAGHNGHTPHLTVCGSCGAPFYAARRPRDWERLYCSDPCRLVGAKERQKRYRARQ